MVLTPPTTNQKAPPIPKRFTKAFQSELRAKKQIELQKQKQEDERRAFEEENSPEAERKKILKYYTDAYGERQGERYKDLYFAQKELEDLKKSGANFKLVFELQKKIAGIQQDISRTASAGQTSKGPGIDTVITKKSGEKIYLQSSETGQKVFVQSPTTTGFSSASGSSQVLYVNPTFVEKNISTREDFNPASNKNFLASSIKGADTFITTTGEVQRAPYTPKEGGAVFTRMETKVAKEIPKQKKQEGDILLENILKANEEFSQKYFPGQLKQFEVGIRGLKFVNEEGRFGIDIYADKNKATTTRIGGDKVSNIVSAPTRAIVGATKFLVELTPFTSQPYETFFLTGGYVSEAYINPVSRGQKTVSEFSDYISERGLISFGVESYVGAKSLSPFFEPFENFATTKVSRLKENILGTSNESLLKNYSIEQTRGTIIIRSKQTGRFAPTSKAPIILEPTQTIITAPSYLKSLEGQTVLAVHTSANFQYGGVIETLSKRISGEKESITLAFQEQRGIRKKLENAPFYFSVPRPGTSIPTAQIGYAGFSRPSLLEVSRPQKFVFFKKTPSLILTKSKVEPTGRPLSGFDIPSKLSTLEEKTVRISAEQERFPGRFTRAPEEVSGLRPFGPELQIVVPTKATEFPLTGRPESIGSTLIKQKRLSERIFYETREPFFFKFFPEKIRLSLFESDFSKRPAKFNLDYGKVVASVKDSTSAYLNESSTGSSRSRREQAYSVVDDYSAKDFGLEGLRSRIDLKESKGREIRIFEERQLEPRLERVFREQRRREATRELGRIINRERFGRETFRERERFRYEERRPILRERNRVPEEYLPRERSRPPEITIRTTERPPRPRLGPPRLPPIRPPEKSPDRSTKSIVKNVFEPGFVAYYVTGGKRGEKVSEQRYTFRDVFNIGALGVQSSIKRTFEIVPEGVAVARNIQGPTNILRPGKRAGTFVEQTKYAISTPLEKRTLKLAKENTIRGNKTKTFRSLKYA